MINKLTKKIFKYTVIYTPEKVGGFTITVPTLPGCVTYGRNLEEAKEMAKDAINLYLESLESHHEIIPNEEDSFISSINLEFPRYHA